MFSNKTLLESFKRILGKGKLWGTPSIRPRTTRLARYYQSKSELRFEMVERLCRYPERFPQDITPTEMVAVLSLRSELVPFDEAIAALMIYAREGQVILFDENFYPQLLATAQDLDRNGFFVEAGNLLKIGLVTATSCHAPEWQVTFQEIIDRKAAAHIRNQPFLKQRRW